MIAVQSFGLKQELEADLPGTIRKIREIGFDGIEPLILFQDELCRMAKENGIDELDLQEAELRLCGVKALKAAFSRSGVRCGWSTWRRAASAARNTAGTWTPM